MATVKLDILSGLKLLDLFGSKNVNLPQENVKAQNPPTNV